MIRFLLVGFITILSCARCIEIDNGVIAANVECSTEAITVSFGTRNPFSGRIFVKGMVDKSECVQNYASGGTSTSSPTVTLRFGECAMQRTRTLSPQAGMMQSIVVIISFHRLFLTKVDKAYKVQCFYMEAEKRVTNELEVSMLTTDDLRDTGTMPTCTYSVRQGSRTGPVVRYAVIGQEVYHEWECDSDNHRLLVKDCYVDDGQGNRQQIIDDRGCALDVVIMPDITYEEELGRTVAWVEAHVFKFADRATVFFQCTLQLCNKGEAECEQITPPSCLGRRRNRFSREVPVLADLGPEGPLGPLSIFPTIGNEMDLLTDSIAVLDLQEAPSTIGSEPDPLWAPEQNPHWDTDSQHEDTLQLTEHGVCLSVTGFGLLLSLVLVIFLVAAAVAGMLCFGRFQKRESIKA